MLEKQAFDLARKGDTKGAAKVLKMAEDIRATMLHPLIHVGGSGGYYDAAQNIYSPHPPRPYTVEERLAMRMGWGRPEECKWAPEFEHAAMHTAPTRNMVFIWVITKDGQSVVLEDEAPLFPSDGLVTKLNMMKQE
jgi:hypothetical protein